MYNSTTAAATTIDTTWEADTNYVITAYPVVTINGVTAATLTSGGTTDSTNLFVFARRTNDGTPNNYAKARFYYIKLYNSSNELIHNYVPCKNGSDVPGFYDTVAEVFVSSASGTELNAGEVLP